MKNYIFGYGSLIESNSRSRTTPTIQEVYPVKIKGFIRGWWGRTGASGLSTTFLGCLRIADFMDEILIDYVTGIIYEVTEEELLLTDIREQGYIRTAVNLSMIEDYLDIINDEAVIWIYINKFESKLSIKESLPSKEYPIVQSYVDICINGCLEIEDLYPVAKETNFTGEFIRSTLYWSSFWVNDRIYPRRPFIMIPNANKIDRMLKENLPDKSIFDNIYFE